MRKMSSKKNMTSDQKIDQLARMMARGFASLESSLRTEIGELRREFYEFREEMYDFKITVHRDILSIHDHLTDHKLRITRLEGQN